MSERTVNFSPQLYARIGGATGILLPAFVAELSFALWLTVKGVNTARWEEKAGAPAS